MFGVCSSRRSPSSMFLFPFQFSAPIWTSGAVTMTSSTSPDSDVIPEVEGVSAQCRRKPDSVSSVCQDLEKSAGSDPDDWSCGEVDVMTSRPSSAVDDDDDCHDDVTVTSFAVTSPSKELKFGIDRILIKDDDVKDTSPIGNAFVDRFFLNFKLNFQIFNYSAIQCMKATGA